MKTTRSLMLVMFVLTLLFGVRAASRAQSLTLTSVSLNPTPGSQYPLTLTGTGFTSTSVAEVAEYFPYDYPGITTTTYVSPTQLTVNGPAYGGNVTVTFQVDVHDTATKQTSNILYFTVYPAPIYFFVYPSSVKAGGGAFTLTAANNHQAPQSLTWTFNGVSTYIYYSFALSPSSVQFYIPASLISTPGVATISAGGYSGGYYPISYYITGNAAITSISPNTASAGDRDFTLTINGTGFAPGDQAQWNGIALQTMYLSSTQLLAFVPASLVSATGSAQITAAYAYPVSFSIPTVHVSGKVALEGETQPAQNVTLAFRPASGTTTTVSAQLAADGSFDVPGITPGSYNLAVKGYKWLQSVTPINAGTAPLAGVQMMLSAGDANNDNAVDTAGFNLLAGAFGGSASHPNSSYDIRADFNDDGIVDTGDFNLLVGNFGNSGDM